MPHEGTSATGDALPEALAGAIDAWLSDHHPGVGPWSLQMVQHKVFPSGRERRLIRARADGARHSVAIKANSDRRTNRAEFAALAALARYTADVVAPLHLAENGQFFAMEWIDAEPFERRLDDASRPEALVRAGAWLGGLHRASRGLEPTGVRLRLPEPPLLVRRGDPGLAAARLRARLRRLPRARGPLVMLHGDAHCGNFFDTGTRIVAFDRTRDFFGLAQADLAKFLVDIAIRRERAAQAGRPWSEDADADRRRIFEGYGPVPEPDLAAFDLAEHLILFKKWHLDLRRGKRQFDGLMRRYGLLGHGGTEPGPGRLVADAAGGAAWVASDAAPPRAGAFDRLLSRGHG